uniref:Uncharacterized protein n=1 Tax=Brassica oleracea TaxID=3712 RepID=A0A3P6FDH9_BRAOL|nr:unnamed protein product [Brassica oleracea]
MPSCRNRDAYLLLLPICTEATHLTADKSFKGAITVFRKVICLLLSGISGNILPWVCWAF